MIANSNKVCVESDICHKFTETPFGTVTCEYESIIAYGEAIKIEGGEAVKALDLLLSHCGYDGFEFDHDVVNILNVYKIPLKFITGKKRFV